MLGLKLNHVSKSGPMWQREPRHQQPWYCPGGNMIVYLHFIINRHWNVTYHWDSVSSKTRASPFCTVSIMAVGGLVIQGARASAAIVLTKNISASSLKELTHWGRDKMAAFSQTTLSNTFSWMKILEFRLKFHWSLFPRVQLTIFQHWFR